VVVVVAVVVVVVEVEATLVVVTLVDVATVVADVVADLHRLFFVPKVSATKLNSSSNPSSTGESSTAKIFFKAYIHRVGAHVYSLKK